MLVYLCRHCEAAPGEPDELRELTTSGRQGAARLGERLAQLDDPPRIVVTSPFIRARQTAEHVSARLGVRILVRDELAPGANVESLRMALEELEGPVAVVAHQPDCSGILYELTGKDIGFQVGESFPLEIDT